MLIALELLTCDFVEEIWMNFVKMRLGIFCRDFESMKIESMEHCGGASVICTQISTVVNYC